MGDGADLHHHVCHHLWVRDQTGDQETEDGDVSTGGQLLNEKDEGTSG